MIRFQEVALLYIEILLQINLVTSQWYNGYANYGSYYVPYTQESGSSFTTSGPITYVPVQGSPVNFVPTYQTNTVQSFDQNPSNGPYPPYAPYPPLNSPLYSNTPTVSYQGLDEANALRSAYPNQPIIIINNGGNGDTGGNSNNGNNNGKRGDRDNFNFGDLAAILLATHRGHGHKGLGGELSPEPVPTITAVPAAAPPVAPPLGINPGFSSNYDNNAGRRDESAGNNKCSTVTNITIILPSSGGTVTVEEKKKKDKNADVKQKKKGRDKDIDKEKEVKDIDTDEEEDVMHDDNFQEEKDKEDEDSDD